MSDKLKPCPFCGNQSPELVGRGGYWWVVCVCGMETKKLNTPTSEEAKDVQVRRWNRRPKESDRDAKVINCLGCGHSVEIEQVPGCLGHPIIYSRM